MKPHSIGERRWIAREDVAEMIAELG